MSNNKDNTPKKKCPGITNNALDALDAVARHDFVHIREISRNIGISPTTAGTVLKGLEENGILAKKTLGKNCFYSLNKGQKTKKLIAILENYRFLKECSNKDFLAMSEDLLRGMNDIKGFIDSIVAYEDGKRYSLLFITSLDNDTIRSKLQRLDIGKVIVFTRENFRNNAGNDMIKNILKNHVVVSGAEKFIDLLY